MADGSVEVATQTIEIVDTLNLDIEIPPMGELRGCYVNVVLNGLQVYVTTNSNGKVATTDDFTIADVNESVRISVS